MSTKTETRVQSLIIEAQTLIQFLTEFGDLLESLKFETMREKLGTDYEDTPYVSFWANIDNVSITVHGPDQRETMRILRKAIGGMWKKGGYGNTFAIKRDWGEGNRLQLDIEGPRENICQRVVTGTSVREIPAIEYQPARVEEVEEVEWVCGNLLD